ncbi:MAG: DUF1576 domain-containing protein [Clostridiales bacterium]|nr:DUF1576 domain-containing protein [Clostridiales bacterium]
MIKINKLIHFISIRKVELVVLAYILIIFIVGLTMQPVGELVDGLGKIIKAPGVLVTDYMVVASIGPALVNAALVSLIGYSMIVLSKVPFTGYSIAAVFTLLGFALLGKNVLSILPLMFGVFIYSKIKREKFSNYIYQALFCTALSPIITQTAFVFNWPHIVVLLFGTLVGIIISPIAKHTLNLHKGYNLYNMGFAAGLTGFAIMSFFTAFGYNVESQSIWGTDFDRILIPLTVSLFVSMVVLGLILSKENKIHRKKILESSGVLTTDYVIISGLGNTLINMGSVGLIGVVYIILVNGHFNGPTVGGLFTMIGFAAFGKHALSIVPIMIGVYLGASLSVYEINSPGPMLAALFGTCLAPITGKFGPIAGIIAGFLHLQLVSVTGQVHGGMNLYNNGFSAGFVAMLFVAIIEGFEKFKKNA